MSKASRRAIALRPVSTLRTTLEVMVVLIALAVLAIPGRARAETAAPGGCEPQVPPSTTLASISH